MKIANIWFDVNVLKMNSALNNDNVHIDNPTKYMMSILRTNPRWWYADIIVVSMLCIVKIPQASRIPVLYLKMSTK